MSLDPFDPIVAAKLRTREMADAITATGRDTDFPEPSPNAVINHGLALQAALRTLTPAGKRAGLFPPGNPDPAKDPAYLCIAQATWKDVHDGKQDASLEQKASAFDTIATVADLLRNDGYVNLATTLDQYRTEQGFGPNQATAELPAWPDSTPGGAG